MSEAAWLLKRTFCKKIPQGTLESLEGWITSAKPLCGFCSAVVNNDLKEAVALADDANREALCEIVRWLYGNAPLGSWGYAGATERWEQMIRE